MKEDYYIIYDGEPTDDVDEDHFVVEEEEFQEHTDNLARRKRSEAAAKKRDREWRQGKRGIPRGILLGAFLIPGAILLAIGLILFAILYPTAWYDDASAVKASFGLVSHILMGVGAGLLVLGDILTFAVRRE